VHGGIGRNEGCSKKKISSIDCSWLRFSAPAHEQIIGIKKGCPVLNAKDSCG
jgi:hypothetical protein